LQEARRSGRSGGLNDGRIAKETFGMLSEVQRTILDAAACSLVVLHTVDAGS